MYTSQRSKKKPHKKPGWRKAEEEHRKWLKSMGIDPDKKPKKREFKEYKPAESYRRETPDYPSCSDSVAGYAPRKESQKYTGTLIKGIATMHLLFLR